MEELRIRYNELESELAQRFSSLLHSNEEIILFENSDLENGESPEDYFERRTQLCGKVVEIFILKVSYYGISTIDAQNNNNKNIIRFSELATIEDRLNLLGLMEKKVKIK